MCDTYPYAAPHSALVSFNDVSGSAPSCTVHERSYSGLAGDLATDTVARYTVITPNLWA